jgi:hypothetical protein
MVIMLNTSQRASRVLPEASENVNEKSITEAEGALREFARDGGVIRRDPKDATDFVANVDLLAGVDRLRRMRRAEEAVATSGRVAGSNGAI